MAAANVFLFILVLSGFSTVVEQVRAQQRSSNISLGSTLSPTTNTTSWLSSSGRFAFGFYPEGGGFNIGIWFAGIPQKTVVWTANQADPQVPSNSMLILTINGLRTNQGKNISMSDSPEPVSSASMLDTGNFVLYNSKLEIIWQSFDIPSDTILQGQRLLNGRELFSSKSETDHSTGKFRLKMQNDGKVVQYPIQTSDTLEHLYYVAGKKNMGYNVTFFLNDDGELYLVNSTGFKIKTVMDPKSHEGRLPTNGSIFYRMTIDVDGIFRLYSHTLYHDSNWLIVEESSSNRCVPKGVCGVYSYCVLTDQNTTDCRCFPGFNFTNEGERTSGCIREVSLEQCENNEKQFRYKMSTLEDIEWEDSFYSVSTLPTEEACRDACLRDCNCEAALFRDHRCSKQRLPLRYGKRRLDGLYTSFIKDNTNKKEIGVLKPNDNNTNNKKSGVLMTIILSVGSTMLVFGLIIIYIIWRWRRKGGNNTESLNEDIELPLLDLITIENATDNFSQTNKIGEGGFGPVYKGKLAEGQEIAVKRLSKDSGQGLIEFKNEVILIAKLQHRNLVKLLGCCIQGEEKMLVYEYMPNESLNYFIFDERRSKLLDWEKRLDIIMGIGRGLLYLHQDSRLRIIHRDLKASNILLDINLNPKISDFGLATLFEGDQTEAKTKRVVGTYGYMSPEYAVDGHFSMKSDVFSFGVLVLEIVSGKRNRGFYHEDHNHNLLGHAWLLWKEGKALELMDKCLRDSYSASSEILVRCIQVGLLCVQQLQEDRPSMSSVVSMLGSENVLIPEPKQPGFFAERSAEGTSREESSSGNQVTISLLNGR